MKAWRINATTTCRAGQSESLQVVYVMTVRKKKMSSCDNDSKLACKTNNYHVVAYMPCKHATPFVKERIAQEARNGRSKFIEQHLVPLICPQPIAGKRAVPCYKTNGWKLPRSAAAGSLRMCLFMQMKRLLPGTWTAVVHDGA